MSPFFPVFIFKLKCESFIPIRRCLQLSVTGLGEASCFLATCAAATEEDERSYLLTCCHDDGGGSGEPELTKCFSPFLRRRHGATSWQTVDVQSCLAAGQKSTAAWRFVFLCGSDLLRLSVVFLSATGCSRLCLSVVERHWESDRQTLCLTGIYLICFPSLSLGELSTNTLTVNCIKGESTAALLPVGVNS